MEVKRKYFIKIKGREIVITIIFHCNYSFLYEWGLYTMCTMCIVENNSAQSNYRTATRGKKYKKKIIIKPKRFKERGWGHLIHRYLRWLTSSLFFAIFGGWSSVEGPIGAYITSRQCLPRLQNILAHSLP